MHTADRSRSKYGAIDLLVKSGASLPAGMPRSDCEIRADSEELKLAMAGVETSDEVEMETERLTGMTAGDVSGVMAVAHSGERQMLKRALYLGLAFLLAGGLFWLINCSTRSDHNTKVRDVQASTVQTQLGPVHGACSEGICRWRNIPFSGQLARFEPSTPRSSSYGTGVGSDTNGPACLQFLDPAGYAGYVGPESEDCKHSS